jgi:acyl carrier protein
VIEDHEVDPHHIALVRLASIPLTTSGKIRRGACRGAFLDDALKAHHRWNRATFYEQAPIPFPELPDSQAASDDSVRVAVRSWMSEWLISRAGVSPEEFCPTKPLGDYGLDSLTAVELSGETEDWTGVTLTPEVAIKNPSVEALSGYIAERYTAESH